MKSLFQTETTAEIINRLNALQPDSPRQWGKMDAAQMLAHCNAAMEVATGHKFPPLMIIGRLVGWLFKPIFLNDKHFQKNSPTDKSFLMKDPRNFETEKARLISLLNEFSEGGPEKCTKHPHSFFGNLTPQEWAVGMYKHLDHHLRQFNG